MFCFYIASAKSIFAVWKLRNSMNSHCNFVNILPFNAKRFKDTFNYVFSSEGEIVAFPHCVFFADHAF